MPQLPSQSAGRSATSASHPEPRSAYIHVPFCAHRCGYCDFTLVAGRDDLIDDYLRALEMDLARLETPRPLDTLFLGGGTPTHLPSPQLSRLMDLLGRWFRLQPGCEFSVEANPWGLDDEKIDVMAAAGVNRVSLGVQSFESSMLSLLERDHRQADILAAVERLRTRIENFSLDLIFGVPGQTLELWHATLAEAIRLAPKHVSTYGLTFEKGTAFWSRRKSGDLVEPPDETAREMYAAAMDTLSAAGYEQYEISNFARPGYRCRHNQVYWRGTPFFGFGPGAARYMDGVREIAHRSVTTWLKRVFAGDLPIAEREALAAEDRARELAAIGMRMCEGLDVAEFRARTGFDLHELGGDTVEQYRSAGLLEQFDGRLRLTREGRFVADTIVAAFL